jgi:hypothetical protein
MARIVLHQAALKQLLQSPTGDVAKDLNRRAQRVQNRAKQLCPTGNGALKASITKEISINNGELVARVGSNLEYALFVHEGTGVEGPRKTPIVPVRARVLRWPVANNSGRGRRRYRGGQTAGYVYSKRSKGSPPNRYLENALPAAKY